MKSIDVQYHHTTQSFNLYYRPIWEWAQDLLQNAQLEPYWVWDAQKLYKLDGEDFICYYDEPWTADRFWEIQVSILSYI